MTVVLVFAGGCTKTQSIAIDIQQANRVNFLTVNLFSVLDVPCLDPAGNWTNRMDRMVEWIRARGDKPDVIALQEAAGWVWCPTNFNVLNDYEHLFYLLRGLNSDSTVNYRIAYLTGIDAGGRGDCGINGGRLGGCHLYAGKALLYNANKLVNLTALETEAVSPHDSSLDRAIALRRSLPACNVSTSSSSLVSFIDGPSGQEKCGQPTPEGKVWLFGGTASTRLAWKSALTGRNEIHVYNVHLHDDASQSDTRHAIELIRFVEQRHAQNRLYPPIILGDFNYPVQEGPGRLPGFTFVGAASATDDGIGMLIGQRASFASEFDATFTAQGISTGEACSSEGSTYWSDHCSLFVTLQPQ